MKKPYVAMHFGENVQLDEKYVPGGNGAWHYQHRFIDVVTNLQYATESFVKDARSTIMGGLTPYQKYLTLSSKKGHP